MDDQDEFFNAFARELQLLIFKRFGSKQPKMVLSFVTEDLDEVRYIMNVRHPTAIAMLEEAADRMRKENPY